MNRVGLPFATYYFFVKNNLLLHQIHLEQSTHFQKQSKKAYRKLIGSAGIGSIYQVEVKNNGLVSYAGFTEWKTVKTAM